MIPTYPWPPNCSIGAAEAVDRLNVEGSLIHGLDLFLKAIATWGWIHGLRRNKKTVSSP